MAEVAGEASQERAPGASAAGRRFRLVCLASCLTFAGLLLHGALLGGALFLRDISLVWLPQAEAFVHCVGQGSLPLWDPYAAFGRPLLADPRAEVLYPLTWLNLLLGPATYYSVFAIGHVALAGVGAALLGRRFGLTHVAALAAAGVYMAGGPLLSLVSMWAHLAGCAYMPWVTWACLRVDEAPTRRRVAVAGAVVALQVLAGSPEMVALTALAVVLVIAFPPASASSASRGRRLVALGACALLGLALSAAQWIPTLDVVRRSDRWSFKSQSALTWSMHPAALVELVVPVRWTEQRLTAEGRARVLEDREPWLRSVYLGIVAVVLAAAALSRPRREAIAPAAMALAGTVLALGRHTPVYAWAAAAVPGVSSFRFPVKALLLAALGAGLLAGLGLDRLREGDRRARGAALLAAAGALALAALVARVVHGVAPVPSFLRAWVDVPRPPAGGALVAALAAAALAGACAWWTPRSRAAVAALAVLACAELASRHLALNPAADRAVWRHRPQALDTLQRDAFERSLVRDYTAGPDVELARRAYTLARAPAGWTQPETQALALQDYMNPPLNARWRVFGSFDADIVGFDPSPLAALQARFQRAGPEEQLRLLRLGAVRNVVALLREPLLERLAPVAERPFLLAEPVRVFRVEDARPRAFVTDGVRVADGPGAVDLLLDPAFDPGREVVLALGEPRPPSGASGRAQVTRFGCSALTLDVEAGSPAHVVLVDAHDPGWRARVDGVPTPVERANVGFRAVPVTAGRHTVELRYLPRPVVQGVALSLVALVVTLALAWPAGRSRQGAAPDVRSAG